MRLTRETFNKLSLRILIVALLGWALPVFMSFEVGATESKAESGEERNKRVIYRKTQDVEFDGSPVDGVVRSPDGAYLSQRRGINFSPLYNLREQFDQNIQDSVDYLR